MPDNGLTRRTVLAAAGGAAGGAAVAGGVAALTGPPDPPADANTDTNADTARRFFALLSEKDIDAWADLWHVDGRIIVYYPADGFPNTIDGKATIVPAFRAMFANFRRFRAEVTAVYSAGNGVVVEYRNDAELNDGTPYTNDNIAVFRYRDGLISAYHDYFDPRRFQVVVDALS
jgi:ketosteroid isomerase-like protein